MKKKVIALLMVAAMAATMAGCGSKASTDIPAGTDDTADEGTQTAERTQFIVGFDAEFPPYGYKDDNGDYTGFDLEQIGRAHV